MAKAAKKSGQLLEAGQKPRGQGAKQVKALSIAITCGLARIYAHFP